MTKRLSLLEQRLDRIEARLDALDGSDGTVDVAYIQNLARRVAAGDNNALRVHNAMARRKYGIERAGKKKVVI